MISPLSSRRLKSVASNSLSVRAPSHDARGRNANGGGWQSVGRSVGARKASPETDAASWRGDRRTDREEDGLQLTFDLHSCHVSHVSLRVGGVAGVLARRLDAHCPQRYDSFLVNTWKIKWAVMSLKKNKKTVLKDKMHAINSIYGPWIINSNQPP